MENSAAAKQWANRVAHYLTDALVTGGAVSPENNASAVTIIEEELLAQLCLRYAHTWPEAPQVKLQ